MALVQRNRPTEWTRPASKTHTDNLFISRTVLPETSSRIFYLQVPPHPSTPSDHLLVGCRSTIAGRRGRMRTKSLQFDNAPLRTCPEHAYSTVYGLRAIGKLGNDPTPEERAVGPSFDQLAETFFRTLLREVKQLRWKTAGGLDTQTCPTTLLEGCSYFCCQMRMPHMLPEMVPACKGKVHTETRGRQGQKTPPGKSYHQID
jgi:hypothetical protein